MDDGVEQYRSARAIVADGLEVVVAIFYELIFIIERNVVAELLERIVKPWSRWAGCEVPPEKQEI